MRRKIIGLVMLGLLSGCQPTATNNVALTEQQPLTAAETQTITQKLNVWLDARYEEELYFSPVALSYQGRKELYDQIDDMSEAAEAKKLAWKEKTIAEMQQKFDYHALTEEGKTSYDLWIFQYQQAKSEQAFERNNYIFEQMGGAQSQLPNFLLNFHKVDNLSDMQAYIARIEGISTAVNQLLERAKLSAASGVRPPRFAYTGAIEQSQKLITGAPFTTGEDAPLWAGAKSQIKTLLEAQKINAAEADALTTAAQKKLTEKFLPAYQHLITWLQADMQQAAAEPQGASSLPNGKAYYNHRLAATTTTSLTADQIHQIGLDEVARIRSEMEKIKNKTNFSGSLNEFFKFMRSDQQFFYPNTDAGRQAYLDDSETFLKGVEAKLPEYFGILPKADLIVKRVEAFREQPGAAQHYYPATPDGTRPGIYYAHLIDMSAYSKAEMEAIAYHEGNPGHHMQISIAQELEDIPKFRTQAGFTVYTEGWALYSEQLAREMHQFENDYSNFGRLSTEMWRAIRLVVDTGLHAKGWSEEQAVAFFMANSSIPETAVRAEVRRYLVWPGQATAYKIGMLKILELRTEAKKQLGDKFDIRGFHDTVLGGGALPVPVLEKRVANWITKTQQA
ncbi:MAG: DUF885 domain-containing protein [Gammaproteobacteria bacterium]|nr:DUF885 domain-containing protein [Gammaproteobacteria bacterium]